MAGYDPYERDYSRRYVREERRDERDPRYVETREHYVKTYPGRELVPKGREDSNLSVEEIPRDFPPPTGRDARRARSAEPGYYEDEVEYRRGGGYDPRHDRDYDRRARRSPGSTYYDEDERRHKSKSGMSKQEKIIAAVAGAALLAGGKELYDRREAKEGRTDVQRNPLATAALAGVGALAAYQGAEFYSKQQAKKDEKASLILHRGRDGYDDYYSDDENTSKEKKGHKNFLENAIAATGLGTAIKSLTGGGGDDRSDVRSRRGGSPSSERSRSRSGANKIQKAAMASLLAGATEAFRVAKEPGGWKGEKSKRILTAAIGAAGVDAATENDGKRGLAEAVIGGLVGTRLLRGSKNDIEEDKSTGRSRSRSRARSKSRGGGNNALAAITAGLGALGAKKALDGSRSRSRRGRDDSYSPSPDRRRQRSRSRSIADKARNSLAKLGLGAGAGAGAGAAAADEYHRRDQDDFSDRGSRRRHYPDDHDDGYDRRGGGSNRDYYEDDRSHREPPRERSRRKAKSNASSSSDLGSSSEDEKRAKRMRGKQVLTTGLATIATIHAAHGVYQSMEKRNARHRAVKEGILSPDQASMLKKKAIMQDAASIGIAALGIKGAVSELKEAKDLSHECKQWKEEKVRRHQKRLEKLQRQPLGERKRSDSWGPSSRPHDGYESDVEFAGPRYYDDNPYGAPYGVPSSRIAPSSGPPPQGRY